MVTEIETQNVAVFITEIKDAVTTAYKDSLVGAKLYMQGQEKHGTDKKLSDPSSRVYLFYRSERKVNNQSNAFIYYGEMTLISSSLCKNAPSNFVFFVESLKRQNVELEDEIFSEMVHIPSLSEGAQRYVQHRLYERNPKNRSAAIKLHGSRCMVCGFDFNEAYSEEYADSYIEVHHIEPLAVRGPCQVNPLTDLIPVCANCHRMLHHRRDNPLTREMLQGKIQQAKYKQS